MSPSWMPLYIADYLGDTQHLSTLEHGAYLLLIMQYWQKGGLPDDETQLMRITRLTPDEWTSAAPVLQRLFKQGWKHERIEEELADAEEKIEKKSAAGSKGGKASALARKRAKEASLAANAKQTSTDASSNRSTDAASTGSTDAAAKFNTTTTTVDSVSSKRAPAAPRDEEKELFDRGKQILGPKAGGLIKKLLIAKGGVPSKARAAIEAAASKQDPTEYIAAAIRGGAGPPAFDRGRPNGGFTEILLQHQREQSNDGVTIDHDDSEFAGH